MIMKREVVHGIEFGGADELLHFLVFLLAVVLPSLKNASTLATHHSIGGWSATIMSPATPLPLPPSSPKVQVNCNLF